MAWRRWCSAHDGGRPRQVQLGGVRDGVHEEGGRLMSFLGPPEPRSLTLTLGHAPPNQSASPRHCSPSSATLVRASSARKRTSAAPLCVPPMTPILVYPKGLVILRSFKFSMGRAVARPSPLAWGLCRRGFGRDRGIVIAHGGGSQKGNRGTWAGGLRCWSKMRK